jgi:ubiquinone biosynthesis protein
VSQQPTTRRARRASRLVGGPAGFRDWLIRLGPTYVKLGQHLALRPDLIPQEYCDELMLLFDRVPPFTSADARAILTEDLGATPEELFASFDPEPFAAGSLAQTHLARLDDGAYVAVKIQRPNIRQAVLRDLSRARLLARLLEAARVSLILTPRQIVDELSEALLQEIDFRHELANLTLLYRLSSGSPIEVIPRPYPAYSGERVLTMEYVHGVPVSELLGRAAHRAAEAERPSESPGETEDFDAEDVDRNRLASNLITATLRQVFRYRFFHGDLHPGNLFAMEDGRVGFVDFGLCDSWDGTMRMRMLRFLSAIYSGEVEQMYGALSEILIPGDRTDMAAFRADFFAESRRWTSRMRTSGEVGGRAELDERSPIAAWMIGVMRVAREHGLQVPPMVVSIYRALLVAETVANRLDADADLRSVGRKFFDRLRVDEVMRAFEPQQIQPTVLNSLALLRDAPGQVGQILSELSEGTFTLTVQAFEPPRVARARDRRARLIATAVLTVSVAVVLSRPDLPNIYGVPLSLLLTALLVLLYLSFLLQWRRLR